MRIGLRILTAAAIVFWLGSGLVRAQAAPDVFITEVQTSSDSSGSDEFIELYNNTDQSIDFTDANASWSIQYFSSTKVTQSDFSWDSPPTGEIGLTGSIPAHDYYLLSTYQPNSVAPDQTYGSPHLADSGGGVQLVGSSGSDTSRYDQVGWSSDPSNGLYATPPAGGSLQRQVDADGTYLDDQGQLGPFVSAAAATPKEPWQAPTEAEDDSGDIPAEPQTAALQITELLPNPASPATDAQDEFVELYNAGDTEVDLTGFTIQTGSSYAYSYTLPDGTLDPGSYIVYTSGDTPLALANGGGQARLLSPGGEVIDETQPYAEAADGQTWALFDDGWQWTTTPTPGSANTLSAPPAAVKKQATKAAAKAAPKAKKAAAKKASSTKKAGAVAGVQTDNNDPAASDQPPTLHPAVLAGVGGAALLYGAYEYRTDLANRLYQLKRYRATRRAARAAVKGA